MRDRLCVLLCVYIMLRIKCDLDLREFPSTLSFLLPRTLDYPECLCSRAARRCADLASMHREGGSETGE